MCDTICPFSCLPERQKTQYAMVSIQADGRRSHEDHPLVSRPVCAVCHLLIILVLHGVLIRLLDLGDEPALGLPVADSPSLVSKPCTPDAETLTRPGNAQCFFFVLKIHKW